MVKKIFYTLLFWTYFSVFLIANEAAPISIEPNTTETCTAPPPDSLRVTSIGSDFVTLAWNPAWVGADHTLSLFKKNGLVWDSLYTIPSVPGSLYTIQNLEPGTEYRIFMRTKCPNGDPGAEYSSIDITSLILELTLLGKTPIDPIVVNCEDIYYQNPAYKWVGFRVYYNTGERLVSNLFQFVKTSSSSCQIRRVLTEHPLVAANQLGEWPTSQFPSFDSDFTIRIGQVNPNTNDFFQIGKIDVSFGSTYLDLCKTPNTAWNPFYQYETLVATKVAPVISSNAEDRSGITSIIGSIKLQNPLNDYIHLFLPKYEEDAQLLTAYLFNQSGQLIFKQEFESVSSEIFIPINSIPSGFYNLRIEKDGAVQNLKAVKF